MKTQFAKHNKTDLLKELTTLSAEINYYLLEDEECHAQEYFDMLLENDGFGVVGLEENTFEEWVKNADISEHIYIALKRSEEVINEIINRKLY